MKIDFKTKTTYSDGEIHKNKNKNIWKQYNYKFL